MNHTVYQERLPTKSELKMWFAHPDNGVGTLGGWHNTIWIDFDTKQFDSQEECDRAFHKLLEAHPGLINSWREKTYSGGYRLAVKCKQKPDFTNFALEPGGEHRGEALGKGRFTVLAPTVGASGNLYVCMNQSIPVEIESLESIGIYPNKAKTQAQLKPSSPRFTTAPTPGGIQLSMLGTRESVMISLGQDVEDDRSASLTKAAKEWFGWENWAAAQGIKLGETAESLASEAGTALGIDSDRVGRILKTIDPGACAPSAHYMGGDMSCWLKICGVNSRLFEEKCPEEMKKVIKAELEERQAEKQTIEPASNVVPITPQVGVKATVSSLLGQSLKESELAERISAIAQQHKWQSKDVWELYRKCQVESDRSASWDEDKEQFKQLQVLTQEDLKCADFLPELIGKPLDRYAELIGVPSAAPLMTLLSTVGSLAKIGTKLKLMKATDFYVFSTMWTMLVADSGGAKSPAQKVIIKPLYSLQAAAFQRYQRDLEDYQIGAKASKDSGDNPFPKPTMRHDLTTDATSEGVARMQSEQPEHGFLIHHDEITALFNGQNAYRGGKGADKEKLLSARDGGAMKVDRAGKESIFVEQISYSITGTTQRESLKRLMSAKDEKFGDHSGQFARFSPVLMKPQPARFTTRVGDEIFLADLLISAFTRISDLPAMEYRLSPDAIDLYKPWFEKLDHQRLTDPNPAFQSIYSKAKGQTGEIALLLHLINAIDITNATQQNSQPSEAIPRQTMEQAIQIMEFLIGQWRLIHNLGGEERGEETSLMMRILEVAQAKGDVSPREVQRNISAFRKISADEIRRLFHQLAQMGKGSIQGSGARIRLTVGPVIDTTDRSVSALSREGSNTSPSVAVGKSVGGIGDSHNTNSVKVPPQNVGAVAGFSNTSVDSGEKKVIESPESNPPNVAVGDRVRYGLQFWVIQSISADGQLKLKHATLRRTTISVDPSEVELVRQTVTA